VIFKSFKYSNIQTPFHNFSTNLFKACFIFFSIVVKSNSSFETPSYRISPSFLFKNWTPCCWDLFLSAIAIGTNSCILRICDPFLKPYLFIGLQILIVYRVGLEINPTHEQRSSFKHLINYISCWTGDFQQN